MKKKLFALSIATSAALISSCTKQNQEEIPGIELNTTCTATLSQNSFDQIGVRHNEILDSVQVSYNDLYDVDFYEIADSVINAELGVTTANCDSTITAIMERCLIEPTNEIVVETFIAEQQGLNSDEIRLIIGLFDIVEQYDGNNLCQILYDVKVFENEAIQVTNGNIDGFLISSSIMRHSLEYWDPYIAQGSWKFNKWRAGFIIACDGLGAAAGWSIANSNPVSAIVSYNAALLSASASSVAGAKIWGLFSSNGNG